MTFSQISTGATICENLKIKNLFGLIVIQCLLMVTVKGIQDSRTSSLLKSYGCLEHTSITVFVPDMSEYEYIKRTIEIIEAIEDPCNTVLIFCPRSRKIIDWKNNLKSIMTTHKSDVGKQNVEFIRSLREQNIAKNEDVTLRILLVLQFGSNMEKDFSRELQLLQRGTDWDVIISCYFNCPSIQDFPINRIVPTIFDREITNGVKDLVKNPDFDKFEYLKHVKMNHVNLTCLVKKTVHVFHLYKSLDLLEDAVLLAHNTKSSHVTLHNQKLFWDLRFWEHYMEQHKLSALNISMEFYNDSYSKLYLNSSNDEIFLIAIGTLTQLPVHHFCNKARKSFLFYGESGNNLNSFNQWYNELHGTCNPFIEKVFVKIYSSVVEFQENFIEELLNVSCF